MPLCFGHHALSILAQIAIADRAVFLRTGGLSEEVTYTPRGGSPSTVRALFSSEKINSFDGERLGLADYFVCYISTEDIDQPQSRDTIVRDGVTWYVDGEAEKTGGTWRIPIFNSERANV